MRPVGEGPGIDADSAGLGAAGLSAGDVTGTTPAKEHEDFKETPKEAAASILKITMPFFICKAQASDELWQDRHVVQYTTD